MEEIWKSIPDYEGLYQVSSLGMVRRIFTKTKLSSQDIEAIFRARARGVPSRHLAPHFGVSYHAIDTLYRKRGFSQREPHLLKLQDHRDGYISVSLCKDGKAKVRLVHQLVLETFIGPRPQGLCVNHINGIRSDNRLINLEYVTYTENALHAYRILGVIKTTSDKGSRRYNAKIVETDVVLMREMREQGMTLKQIGTIIPLSEATISKILLKKAWRHVP